MHQGNSIVSRTSHPGHKTVEENESMEYLTRKMATTERQELSFAVALHTTDELNGKKYN